MTLEELRAKYPDEIAQAETAARASADHTEAVNAAVQAERARMQEIDEVSSLLDPTAVQQAKYGDKPLTAAELLVSAAKAAAKQGKKFLSDLKDDADDSGADDVGATPPLTTRRKTKAKRRRKRRWQRREPPFPLCSARRRRVKL